MTRKKFLQNVAFILIACFIMPSITLAQDTFSDSLYRAHQMAVQRRKMEIEAERLKMEREMQEIKMEQERLKLEKQKMQLERQKRENAAMKTYNREKGSQCEADCERLYVTGQLKQDVTLNDCIRMVCQ